ncbi:MAG: hemerythrin family protein [Candidatus Thiodiazotropha sp. (ex Lucinoma borealis)]|nr:hemerythrin family protein [Candidatus Thiodiazotropha sp. (ex Lucinoma borealis)]
MKKFLQWRDDWYLGVDEIDQQHLALVDLVNRIAQSLEDSEQPSGSKKTAMDLLLLLQDETRSHFKDEEDFMRIHDYPEQRSHHREHALLQAELRDLIREVEEQERLLDLDILISLKHWLINHVIDSDLEIACHLKKRGTL